MHKGRQLRGIVLLVSASLCVCLGAPAATSGSIASPRPSVDLLWSQRSSGWSTIGSGIIDGQAWKADTQGIQSYGRLGHGQLKAMQWEAWGEVKTARGKGGGVEEACVAVATLEPTEGNESTNCGPPESKSLEEIVRSPYGVVATAMYAPEARRVVICVKGGRELEERLTPIRLRAKAARPTRSYSYFARGFGAGTRIKWITALDAGGKVMSAGAVGRRCL